MHPWQFSAGISIRASNAIADNDTTAARKGAGRHAALLAGIADKDMKAHAAAYAWIITKEAGGKTVLDTYGNTQVEILRDTGQTIVLYPLLRTTTKSTTTRTG